MAYTKEYIFLFEKTKKHFQDTAWTGIARVRNSLVRPQFETEAPHSSRPRIDSPTPARSGSFHPSRAHSSTSLLFPPPRHATRPSAKDKAPAAATASAPAIKPRPLAAPPLLLLSSSAPRLSPPRRAPPGPLLLLFVRAVPLSSDLPAALRRSAAPPPFVRAVRLPSSSRVSSCSSSSIDLPV